MKHGFALLALLTMTTASVWASTATFDSKNTGTNNYYRPATPGNYDWTDGGITMGLEVVDDGFGGTSWGGITYSDVNNPTNGNWSNQYAAYGSGSDFSGSGVYGVGYVDSFNGINPTVSFGAEQTAVGFQVNNTAYAALDMLNGSGFSKVFGGATGNDADWFMLTVEGFNDTSASQGTVDFYLADYRFADNGQDYIIDDWTYVDLTSLGTNVSSLTFSLSSSDTGAFGMNTPAYFAIDEIQAVPEPASIMLILLGSSGIFGFRKYKSHLGL